MFNAAACFFAFRTQIVTKMTPLEGQQAERAAPERGPC
jgi:hypothetical protein